jgi:adenylate cyclase
VVGETLSIAELADRAGVEEAFIDRLIELGALDRVEDGYGEREVHLVALLHRWAAAGLRPEWILEAAEKGDLSLSWLETPGFELPRRLDRTYGELAAETGVPLQLVLGLHEVMGFARPDADARIREDDPILVELARILLEGGASEEAVRRMFRVYADNLRRLATAVADVYRAEVEKQLRESGVGDSELMEYGARIGHRMGPAAERVLVAIYERHRQHVWTEYSVERAETVLDRAGLRRRVERPPAVCFVDLTGFTRLTEERGDEVAARLAANLSALVEEISRRHGGRAVRWLGDGGMFLFADPKAAVLAALEMVERAPAAGLPPTHIGIQAGPVILQDGDVYGMTVNVAARLADRAEAGEVLTTEETVAQVQSSELRFERIGPASLEGVVEPVMLHRARHAEGREVKGLTRA